LIALGAAAMGFIPESVRVMGARATESGQNTWEIDSSIDSSIDRLID